jgi:hypothetical protein
MHCCNDPQHGGALSPALGIIKVDINHDTLHISQLVADCQHSHCEKQTRSDTAIPDIVQRQVKVSVVMPPTCTVEWLGRVKKTPGLAVNAFEWLAVHELFT